MSEDRAQKNLYLPRKLLDKLKKFAKQEHRSERSIVELALEEYFQRRSTEPVLPEELQRAVEEYLDRRLQPKK